MEQFKDIELKCSCGKEFIWSIGEQEFINNLLESGKISSIESPKRCLSCRNKRKQQRAQQERDGYSYGNH